MAYSGKEIETLFDEICERISEGEALSKVLKSENMPSRNTFYQWLIKDEMLQDKYARATELRAELMFEDIINISDSVGQDMIEQPDGTLVTNHNIINRDRLRIDSRKWALSKMMPKKYGDKLDIDHTTKGKEINQPPTFIFSDLNPKNE